MGPFGGMSNFLARSQPDGATRGIRIRDELDVISTQGHSQGCKGLGSRTRQRSVYASFSGRCTHIALFFWGHGERVHVRNSSCSPTPIGSGRFGDFPRGKQSFPTLKKSSYQLAVLNGSRHLHLQCSAMSCMSFVTQQS